MTCITACNVESYTLSRPPRETDERSGMSLKSFTTPVCSRNDRKPGLSTMLNGLRSLQHIKDSRLMKSDLLSLAVKDTVSDGAEAKTEVISSCRFLDEADVASAGHRMSNVRVK